MAGLLFGSPGAGSFVRAGARGLVQACEALGCMLDLQHVDSTDADTRTRGLLRLAEGRPDLIVVHGGQGDAPLARVAPRFPAQRFALTQGLFQAPNVAVYEVRLEEPAMLAGALAAWTSGTGVIAHLSGERVGPGLRGEAAYREGALRALPQVQVLSAFCGHQHDPALARSAVMDHAAHGADVLFTMLGEGREGAIAACRATGMRHIGDGIDWCAQAPDDFIAAAVADVAWCCSQAVHDAVHGRLAPGTRRSVGLEQPEVCRLALHPGTPAALRARLAMFAQDMLARAP